MAQTIASHRTDHRPSTSSTVVTEAATAEDSGKLILRLAVAILILMHGVAKITGGIGPIAEMLTANGLPPDLAYGVYIGEVLAPLLVIVGVWTRPAALLIAVNMMFAVALVHMKDIFVLGEQGGWALELQGMYLFGALAVMLLGAGRLSVGGLRGRWN